MLPIKIHVLPSGPNPWKPVLILEELGLPYSLNSISIEAVKQKPFIDINPNGRSPAIEDPNTGLTLWESGAIVQYLIEQYDTNHTLSFSTLHEKHLCNQWLAFQISGQGPYFGQAAWFTYLHPEKFPSAIARYVAEIKRILSVLNTALEGKDWLVGDKMTFADLAFTHWNDRIDALIMCKPEEQFDEYPNVKKWHERMVGREAWKAIMGMRVELMDQQGFQANGLPKGINSPEEYQEMVKKKMEGK